MGSISERDEALRERFRELLLGQRTPPAAGWQLAADIGRPVAPLLWRMFDAEKAVEKRLTLLAAAMIAGGPGDDARLFQWLERNQQKVMLSERAFAALVVALGPRRPLPVPGFFAKFLGDNKNVEQLLACAVRLAAARIPGVEEGMPVSTDDDPGVAAATAWCGLPVSAGVQERLWNLRAPARHAELFWRGALLGAARARARVEIPAGLLDRAKELLERGETATAAAQGAAMWLRSAAGKVGADGQRLDDGLLRIAVANAPTADVLRRWLGPKPQPRDEEPWLLAAAYALSRPPEEVLQESKVWGTNPAIQRHVAVALAWQMLGNKHPNPTVDTKLAGVPEWNFVRWAAGASLELDVPCEDARLQSTLQLCAEGRIERPAVRDVLEEALWRWGSHPQAAVWQLERAFVRDVLLAGSEAGGAKYLTSVPPHERYFPTGLGREVRFFEIAVALFEFLGRPTAPIPPEHRLPG